MKQNIVKPYLRTTSIVERLRISNQSPWRRYINTYFWLIEKYYIIWPVSAQHHHPPHFQSSVCLLN